MVIVNLWNPQNLDLLSALIVSYLLGIVHGITPDEHTWPITFSYAVGSYSTKGGAKAGFSFSSGFTIQRAILSEIAYFALAGIFMTSFAFGITYVLVGIAMAAAGIYISKKGKYLHWHYIEKWLYGVFNIHKEEGEREKEELEHMVNPVLVEDREGILKPIPTKLAFVHGVIAGFGFGAFALIIYTVIAPSMPSPWWGFMPGLLFGLGTMTMQVIFGATFGKWLSSAKKLTTQGIAFVSKMISTDVLTYGGVAFLLAGASILYYPQLLNYNIITPIKVHNLHSLGIGFFLVIIVVVVIGIISYRRAVRKAAELGFTKG